MRLETNEAWIISKVFGEIDIFIYSPLYEPDAFHFPYPKKALFMDHTKNAIPATINNAASNNFKFLLVILFLYLSQRAII